MLGFVEPAKFVLFLRQFRKDAGKSTDQPGAGFRLFHDGFVLYAVQLLFV